MIYYLLMLKSYFHFYTLSFIASNEEIYIENFVM